MHLLELSDYEKAQLKEYATFCNHGKKNKGPKGIAKLFTLGLVSSTENHIMDRGLAYAVVHLRIPFSKILKAHDNLRPRFQQDLDLYGKLLQSDDDLDAYGYAKMFAISELEMFEADNTFRTPTIYDMPKAVPLFYSALLDWPTFDFKKVVRMMGINPEKIKDREQLKAMINASKDLLG